MMWMRLSAAAGVTLAFLVLATPVFAHGATETPPPPPEPIPRPKRREPPRQPEVPPAMPGEPPAPVTPPEPPVPGKLPDQDAPTPPPPPIQPKGQDAPLDPREGVRKGIRPSELENRVSSTSDAWRLWWEYNREHLVGIRRRVRERIVLTGDARASDLDPLGERRGETIATLRRLAIGDKERDVRASALIALGRLGGDDELRLALHVFRSDGEPDGVREAAAVAYGLVGACDDPALRDAARGTARWVLDNPGLLPQRAEGMFVLATGLRARHDPSTSLSRSGWPPTRWRNRS